MFWDGIFTHERGLEMSERTEQKNFKNAAIIGVISVNCCNPNGDPGNNNRPRVHRINGLEYGWVSQYRIKRFIRDTAETLFDKKNLFRSGVAFNDAEELIKLKDSGKGKNSAQVGFENVKKIRDTFWDINQFGMVCTGSVASKVGGNNIVGIWNVGAVSLSIVPIVIDEHVITRDFTSEVKEDKKGSKKKAAEKTPVVVEEDDEDVDGEEDPDEEPVVGETEGGEKKKVSLNQNVGSQKIVLRGYYRVVMQLNSAVAKKFGYTEEDINEFYEVVCEMFNGSTTAGASKYGMGWLSTPKLIMGESGSIEYFESKMDIKRSDKNADNTTPISLLETVEMVWK
jgi:CRISPR/Cas system type I-B associated protein Csh2 (Cas7 group RAMP superfamily)